jgi:hypothetical protein
LVGGFGEAGRLGRLGTPAPSKSAVSAAGRPAPSPNKKPRPHVAPTLAFRHEAGTKEEGLASIGDQARFCSSTDCNSRRRDGGCPKDNPPAVLRLNHLAGYYSHIPLDHLLSTRTSRFQPVCQLPASSRVSSPSCCVLHDPLPVVLTNRASGASLDFG